MYVPDGTSGRFERVDMTHVLEHVLIVIERHQPQGAVSECERLRVFERAFAKVPQEQQARIMDAVRADAADGGGR